jgi:NAD(P)-dependent dehydrogenase (short-subunit alcohol dehydrogenase family)
MRLDGKVALVTGTSSGIGAAIAKTFVAAGARVFGVDRQPPLVGLSGDFYHMNADLAEAGIAPRIFAECTERFGSVDILVNNAGIGNARSILDTSDNEFDRYLTINLKAPFALCREAVKTMAGRGGAIINIASVFGIIGASQSAAYVPTKSGIIGLTRNLAAEFGRDGIRVNAVAPGLIATPLTRERLNENEWFRKTMIETCPLGRCGDPAEVADAVLYLASDRSSFVHGVVLPVDGGWSITKVVPRPR